MRHTDSPMKKQPEPIIGAERLIFICYRELDGLRHADWTHSVLVESLKARGKETHVYLDQTEPATSDWTAVQSLLERALALVVILTPGLYSELPGDCVHKEIDWWLKQRSVSPILVDTTGDGERWIPKKIKSRWPLAQRVNLDRDLWIEAKEEDREQIRAQVGEQIIGAIEGSRFEVVEQVRARARRPIRAAAVSAIAVAAAGLVYLGYTQTAYYQIDTIIRSAPVRLVAEQFWRLESRWAVQDYLRALAAYKPDKAVNAAEQIPDLNRRIEGLVAVAEGQLDAGHKAQAQETLRLAVRIVRNIEDSFYQVMALASIAREQAQAGPIAEADETWKQASQIDTRLKTEQLAQIAASQAKAGRFTEAYRTTQKISDFYSKAQALIGIAEGQSESGRSAEAGETLAQTLRMASGITDPRSRAVALAEIGLAQAKAGQFAQAHRTVQSITDRDLEANALVWIAEQEAKAGRVDEAKATARRIADERQKDLALLSIARRQADAGRFTEAERTADEIVNTDVKNGAFGWIVDAAAKAGRFEEAKGAASRIPDEYHKQAALVSIAEGYAQAGQIAEATRALRAIWSPQDPPRVWIAEGQARAHGWRAARATADSCSSPYRLSAYAAILNQYMRMKGLKLKASYSGQKKTTEGPPSLFREREVPNWGRISGSAGSKAAG